MKLNKLTGNNPSIFWFCGRRCRDPVHLCWTNVSGKYSEGKRKYSSLFLNIFLLKDITGIAEKILKLMTFQHANVDGHGTISALNMRT